MLGQKPASAPLLNFFHNDFSFFSIHLFTFLATLSVTAANHFRNILARKKTPPNWQGHHLYKTIPKSLSTVCYG
jgi:hypothetical protein